MATPQKKEEGGTPPPPRPQEEKPAAAPVEQAPQKPRKERKKRKPRANVQVWKLYKVSENSIERLRKECPRCGRGHFMAEHKDRLSCGHCGYTTFQGK